MVARLEAGDPGSNLADDTRAFMPQNGREHALGVGARQGEGIRMADACGHDFDQHLAGARAVEIDFHDFKGLAGFHGYGGTGLHVIPPSPRQAGHIQ